jgi:hypothetical protein
LINSTSLSRQTQILTPSVGRAELGVRGDGETVEGGSVIGRTMPEAVDLDKG